MSTSQDRGDIAASLLLEKLDVDLYRSKNLWKPHPQARAVFGGQIIGQALVAAHQTINDKDLAVHSMHAYFLLGGDPDTPAVYHVDRIRDGRSFSTRSVLVKQNGKAIFSAQVSFHKPEESPLDHYRPMPSDVPPPEECLTRREYLLQEAERFTKAGNKTMAAGVQFAIKDLDRVASPLETRYVDPRDSVLLHGGVKREGREATTKVWVKCKTKLPALNWAHDCVAAYASDSSMLVAAAKPLGTPHTNYKMMASLDHTMWFHAPFRADEWLYYEVDCPRAKAGRAVLFGRIYKANGELVVTVAQEGVMRLGSPTNAPKTNEKKEAKL